MYQINPYVFPPMTGDPYYPYVTAMLHFNGTDGSTTFTDSCPIGATYTRTGSTTISTADSKFGGASGRFPGSGSNLITPSVAGLNFGTTDFTVEMWINRVGTAAATKGLICKTTTGGIAAWGMTIDPNERLSCRFSTNGTSGTLINTSTILAASTWHHVAFVRNGGTLLVFVNGVQEGSNAIGGAAIWSDSAAVSIGSVYQDASSGFNGYIDELRITKGAPRYTANFTPPAAPFPDA